MNKINEFYNMIGGNYLEVKERMQNDEMIKYFILKFKEDKNYSLLGKAIANSDANDAFRYAHTLKGVCLNLSFTNLYKVVFEITEKLRKGDLDNINFYYEKVMNEYEKINKAVSLL